MKNSDFHSHHSQNVSNVGTNRGIVQIVDYSGSGGEKGVGNQSLVILGIVLCFFAFVIYVIAISGLASVPLTGGNSDPVRPIETATQNGENRTSEFEAGVDHQFSDTKTAKNVRGTQKESRTGTTLPLNRKPQRTPNQDRTEWRPPECVFSSEGCR